MRQRNYQFPSHWLTVPPLLLLLLCCLDHTCGEEVCNEFLCDDGKCISKDFVCDGDNDCGDMSDERRCEMVKGKHSDCTEAQFMCSDLLCIPKEWVCDGFIDCLDGSDEHDQCEAHCLGFTCANHKCVPSTYHCDGEDDCGDNSDEQGCTPFVRDIHVSHCTLDNQYFKCNDGSCTHLTNTCNGKHDCADGSDEGGMCSQSGSCNTTNCSNGCHMTPQGPACTCPKGFSYNQLQHKCEDIDECAIYGMCDQRCSNHPGNYTCHCEPGYKLDADNHTCRATVSDLPHVTAVGYDGLHVYWTIGAHEGAGAIMRSKLDGKDQEVLVTAGLNSPEDMALDWITKNIYFTDAEMKHIGVCSDNGVSCVVLHDTNIDKPRGIVLRPTEGLMYWSDWGERPLIARSGMDGSQPTDFVTKGLHWPNGLAIDHGNQRLYWVDAKLQKIESIKLDGTDRREVLTEYVEHPYSIAVFEDSIFWSDLKGLEIQSCNKFTGKNRTSIIREKTKKILGIHVFHNATMNSQISNPCVESGCSDLCLLAPASKPLHYTCACPENKRLAPNGHFCIETRKRDAVVIGAGHTLIELEHRQLGRHNLSEVQLQHIDKIGALAYDSLRGTLIISDATNGRIVTLDTDYVHEAAIVSEGIGKVSGMDFDPYGYNLYWTDSEHRTVEAISMKTFERTRIILDLGGESPMDVALVPTDGIMFIALSGPDGAHIDKWSMDGDPKSRVHFIDHLLGPHISLAYDREMKNLFWADPIAGIIKRTDITGTERHVFRELHDSMPADIALLSNDVFWSNRASSVIKWGNKYNAYIKDNEISLDFSGGLDTVKIITIHGLDSQNSHECQHNLGGCSDLCLVTPHSKVCACRYGMQLKADNHNCEYPSQCDLHEFHCLTGECIPAMQKCNGHKDCPMGEDEFDCNGTTLQCPRGQFPCHNGEACISEDLKCDKYLNCRDGSDEWNCGQCKKNEFPCKSGDCISLFQVCNTKIDCPDGDDEFNCEVRTCQPKTEFRCLSGQCIAASWECDDDENCEDRSDEHSGCIRKCERDQKTCGNKKCVDYQLVCDGNDDCGDNTDEMDCGPKLGNGMAPLHPQNNTNKTPTRKCIDGLEFACESQPGVCLLIEAKCNGTSECLRGEDENDCSDCHMHEFRCANTGRCILNEWRCDGTNDCGDDSDEDPHLCRWLKNQKPDLRTECSEYQCRNKRQCLPFNKVCDGHYDCDDNSDEGGRCSKSCSSSTCQDQCQETPVGFICSCSYGYELSGDGRTCIDIDECKKGTYCAQECENTPGSYSCDCKHEGYQLKEDRMRCKAVGSEMQVIYALEDKIRYVSKSRKSLGVVYSSRDLVDFRVSGMDVDARKRLVYWSSEVAGVLSRVSLDNRNNIEIISSIQRPSKISLDWVMENVYFIENQRQIKLCHFGIQKCSLIYTAEDDGKIYALAVDPVSRTMFWSESRSFGRDDLMLKSIIKRSDMSGSSVRVIVDTSLEYVADLVVDNVHNKIFWIDQMRKTVESAKFDGTNRNLLFNTEHEPIKVELFEDSVYWLVKGRSPQNKMSLQAYGNLWKCGLFGPLVWNCDVIQIHPRNMLSTPYIFKIMQEALQPKVNNDCNNKCSHICVPLSPSNAVCLCEDGSLEPQHGRCKNTTIASTNLLIITHVVFLSLVRYLISVLAGCCCWTTWLMMVKLLDAQYMFQPSPEFAIVSSSSPIRPAEGSNLWWTLWVFITVFVLLPGVIIILYMTFQEDVHKYFKSKPNKFMFSSIHFQNPAYGMTHRESSFHHARLSPGHHQYENPITNKVDEENVYIMHPNEMKITNGDECNDKRTKIQVIDVADDESSGTEYADPVSESHKAPLIR